jgi:hypothetical protein
MARTSRSQLIGKITDYTEDLLRNLPWQKIILFILILTITIGLSGCQSEVVKDLKNTIHAFSQVPHQLDKAFTSILGSLNDIGGALAKQISNIVGRMTGR